MKVVFWGIDNCKIDSVHKICQELGIEICENSDFNIYVKKDEELSLVRDGNTINITYSKDNEIFRAISMLSRLSDEKEIHPSLPTFLEYDGEYSRRSRWSLVVTANAL